MNLNDLKDKLNLELSTQPQRQAKALQGLESIRAGQAELAALGYRLVVEEEALGKNAALPEEFPKMLFLRGGNPPEVTVEDEEEEGKAREKGYAGLNEVPKPKVEVPAPVPAPKPPAEPVKATQAAAQQT